MFALGICYLNGWAMAAADGARKTHAEWPPHPDRVFMALAAAWFETTEDADEGAALRWLEGLPPPSLAASDASARSPVTSYAPVNDVKVGRVPARATMDKLKNAGLGVLPEHRSRQPRGFPVAIPQDPTVHLIWPDADLDGRNLALERLAAKVTHIGNSASFVQVWVEQDRDIEPTWVPAEGMATHRLRIPASGRLDQLAHPHQTAWQAEADRKAGVPPPRVPWRRFPDAVLLANEAQTRRHPEYALAKSGDGLAARRLIDSLLDESPVADVRRFVETSDRGAPALVCAHSYEHQGVNAIPAALAEWLSARLGIPFIAQVVQSNVVSHTGADGYGRLARQARFVGDVDSGREYVMVDDFIGQGGTMANLRGWVQKQGGTVIGTVALTGKPYSAKLNPTKEQLRELRDKHGREFEKWWRAKFGHAFNCLTQSEARYLARSPDVDTIRDRLAAAERQGDRAGSPGSHREQDRRTKELKSYRPPTPRRPVPTRWQGYSRPLKPAPDPTPHTVFDPHIIVLAINGRRASLPATLKLTAALRGLLMHQCPIQPPPEWFSGHRADGRPSADPHLALAPLPFVGSPHADGRIMGLGLIVPMVPQHQEVGRCLEPILRDSNTGLPRDDLRLFDGGSFDLGIELDRRERPPWNLQHETWTRPSRTWASVTPVVLSRHF
ncbi:MAG: type I-U CRISPR-associated protein Csb2, partial [Gammaproteobacteria bacterium]|nr:type I-U CRISPR-associated protein Csb2 [Gammaproteobacteria bacterium]